MLARTLRPRWESQPRVGILLPPSVAAALLNVAAPLCGKTSVNLNYTVGKSGLEAAVRLAELRTIVTSRLFVEKAKLELPDGPTVIWLEDIAQTIGAAQKLFATLLAVCAPARVIERICGQKTRLTVDDLATIIFSSGSTGEPKGVMLSHFSIDANAQGATQVLHLYQRERVLGILPFFHSFGYLVFWFVMFNNAALVFHPSPLDVAAIGELVRRYRITFLVTTPTFLQLYQRRCTPEQFSSLRVVLTGAEKLPARLAQAFEDRFGLDPIEGYGVTECAPVVAVNCPDFRAAGYFQPASRRGTVGQPLPGVSVQIVDPDSFAPLPPGTPGMLLVKGPNVMNGYLGREDLTANVMRDGWYITGDIALVDDDGFLTITDRLSRFSKIGGEMVPHGQVEEALQQAAGADMQVFAVTGIPDERKGEQLAVLHTLEESQIPGIVAKLIANGLPNLFIPPRPNFVKVDALPVLGTGKMDLRSLKRIAMERLPRHDSSGIQDSHRLPCASGRAARRRQRLLHFAEDAQEPAVSLPLVEARTLSGSATRSQPEIPRRSAHRTARLPSCPESRAPRHGRGLRPDRPAQPGTHGFSHQQRLRVKDLQGLSTGISRRPLDQSSAARRGRRSPSLADAGAVLVKVLPNAQQFNPADPRYKPFYRALAERNLPFLSHVGYEFSLIGKDQSLGDPDRLRLALDEGATVIAAHACSYGLIFYEKFLPTIHATVQTLSAVLCRHFRTDTAQSARDAPPSAPLSGDT